MNSDSDASSGIDCGTVCHRDRNVSWCTASSSDSLLSDYISRVLDGNASLVATFPSRKWGMFFSFPVTARAYDRNADMGCAVRNDGCDVNSCASFLYFVRWYACADRMGINQRKRRPLAAQVSFSAQAQADSAPLR